MLHETAHKQEKEFSGHFNVHPGLLVFEISAVIDNRSDDNKGKHMMAYHLIDGVGDAEYTGCHKDGSSEEEN